MNRFLTLFFSIFFCLSLWADEGMWMLNNLTRENREKMREMGFVLADDQLYHDSIPSLYQAVVQFDGNCTGVTVSNRGLVLTNHHCGYEAIQSQSSTEHDFLKNGFVARTPEEEIPVFGMFVLYLEKTINVTHCILDSIPPNISEKERENRIEKMIFTLKEQIKNTWNKGYMIDINSYYSGNEYYAHIYKMYSDIRLVFAPPSSIGKFGGETDNWMWPRHTGDFCLFRVYAGKENEPADYDSANQPYKPAYFAPISLNGYENGSFAMAIGYPGKTDRYLSSWGIERKIKSSINPIIEVNRLKQTLWKEAMEKDDAIRMKYAFKYALSANSWKNSLGMSRDIDKKRIIEKKQTLENQFLAWIEQTPGKKEKYGNVLNLLQEGYLDSMDKVKEKTYIAEIFQGVELIKIAYYAYLIDFYRDKISPETYFDDVIASHYKNLDINVDKKVLVSMLNILKKNFSLHLLPPVFSEIEEKSKGNYDRYISEITRKSILASSTQLKDALSNEKKIKKLGKDPLYKLSIAIYRALESLYASMEEDNYKINEGERLFMAGLREMIPEKNFPPDANFTMRLTYGNVGGYKPYDGVWYDYYTTSEGVLEKYDAKNPEFNIQPEIVTLFGKKDFGKYSNKEGSMNLNFLSNLDISGGNSGSPIFNGEGHLIGLAFDGNWEAMSGDIAFETDVQKCIAVDIRYILFVIDQWGNCPHILDELLIQ
jgi:hypothetical protein